MVHKERSFVRFVVVDDDCGGVGVDGVADFLREATLTPLDDRDPLTRRNRLEEFGGSNIFGNNRFLNMKFWK